MKNFVIRGRKFKDLWENEGDILKIGQFSNSGNGNLVEIKKWIRVKDSLEKHGDFCSLEKK